MTTSEREERETNSDSMKISNEVRDDHDNTSDRASERLS